MINMSNWFLRLAVLYLIAGVGLGLYMAASKNHSMFPVHAHLNLLGWVSLTLFGLFYRVVPSAATTTLAKLHFWVYVPAHFVQMVLLAMFFRGVTAVEPALGAVSTLVGVAIVMFAVVVWQNTPAPASAPQ
jgi:cbb3-type cytochrome oxidase subunit 1